MVVVESVKDGDVDAEGEAICINGVGAMPDEVNRYGCPRAGGDDSCNQGGWVDHRVVLGDRPRLPLIPPHDPPQSAPPPPCVVH